MGETQRMQKHQHAQFLGRREEGAERLLGQFAPRDICADLDPPQPQIAHAAAHFLHGHIHILQRHRTHAHQPVRVARHGLRDPVIDNPGGIAACLIGGEIAVHVLQPFVNTVQFAPDGGKQPGIGGHRGFRHEGQRAGRMLDLGADQRFGGSDIHVAMQIHHQMPATLRNRNWSTLRPAAAEVIVAHASASSIFSMRRRTLTAGPSDLTSNSRWIWDAASTLESIKRLIIKAEIAIGKAEVMRTGRGFRSDAMQDMQMAQRGGHLIMPRHFDKQRHVGADQFRAIEIGDGLPISYPLVLMLRSPQQVMEPAPWQLPAADQTIAAPAFFLAHGHGLHRLAARDMVVQIGQVRQVHQIVDQQLGPRPDREMVGRTVTPALDTQPKILIGRDQIRVAPAFLTHPDPAERAAFLDPIGRLAKARARALRGNRAAFAIRLEHKAVIAADQSVAFDPPFGQREIAVRAKAVHRNRLAGLRPIEDQRLIQYCAAQRSS
ncbi:hypothetical protein E4T56_gene6175, partial [Termitomyces sp. T112]